MSKRKKVTESFIQIHHLLFDSEEFAGLPDSSVRLLVAVIRRFNGHNNGDIHAGQEALMGLCNFSSPTTLIRAFKELVNSGLVVVTFPGSQHLARRVALAWHPPSQGLPDYVRRRSWSIWHPGAVKGTDFEEWRPQPVKKRKQPDGRPPLKKAPTADIRDGDSR